MVPTRLRTLLALIVVLVFGSAGAAVAQTPGTAEVVFINEVTGFGPVSVGITNETQPEFSQYLGIVGELGEARTTLPAGPGYVLNVASPDALDEPLAVTEPIELVAGNRYVTIAIPIPEGDGIGFNSYLSDPIQGGNVRIVHRTGRPETLQVNLRNGIADYDEGSELLPGAVEDRVGLVNGRYGVDITIAGTEIGEAIDNLPVEAGQWTVITVVADQLGIRLEVTGPGPLPSASPAATPSPSPSPAAIRTPPVSRPAPVAPPPAPTGRTSAVLVALGLLTGGVAVVVRSARSAQKNQAPEV